MRPAIATGSTPSERSVNRHRGCAPVWPGQAPDAAWGKRPMAWASATKRPGASALWPGQVPDAATASALPATGNAPSHFATHKPTPTSNQQARSVLLASPPSSFSPPAWLFHVWIVNYSKTVQSDHPLVQMKAVLYEGGLYSQFSYIDVMRNLQRKRCNWKKKKQKKIHGNHKQRTKHERAKKFLHERAKKFFFCLSTSSLPATLFP